MSRSSDRDGSLMQSFLHWPLLSFNETRHVVFMPFGEWMTVAGAQASSRSPGSYSVSRPMRSTTSSAVHGSMSEPQRLSR